MLRVLSVPEARCRPSTMNLRMLLSTKTLNCSPGGGGAKRERAESTMAYGSASSDHSTYLIDLSGLGMGSILARVASNFEGKVSSVQMFSHVLRDYCTFGVKIVTYVGGGIRFVAKRDFKNYFKLASGNTCVFPSSNSFVKGEITSNKGRSERVHWALEKLAKN